MSIHINYLNEYVNIPFCITSLDMSRDMSYFVYNESIDSTSITPKSYIVDGKELNEWFLHVTCPWCGYCLTEKKKRCFNMDDVLGLVSNNLVKNHIIEKHNDVISVLGLSCKIIDKFSIKNGYLTEYSGRLAITITVCDKKMIKQLSHALYTENMLKEQEEEKERKKIEQREEQREVIRQWKKDDPVGYERNRWSDWLRYGIVYDNYFNY